MLKKLWNILFGTKENTLNVNIEIKNLDKIVEVLSNLSNSSAIINTGGNQQKNEVAQKNIVENAIDNKKEHLKEDPATAKFKGSIEALIGARTHIEAFVVKGQMIERFDI